MNFLIKKLILILFLSVQVLGFDLFKNIISIKDDQFMPFGIISIPQPEVEEIGEEGNLFFNEFSTDVYSLYNNGIIQISSKYKVPVKIKDVSYRYFNKEENENRESLLIPNYEDRNQIEAIDHFYSKLYNQGARLLKKIANDNRVVALAFGHIANSQVKRAIKSGVLVFAIKVYLYQSEAIMYKTVKVNVENLATDPYYDPELLVSKIESNVLSAYSQVIATVKQSGGIAEEFEESAKSEESAESEETESVEKTESESVVDDQTNENEDSFESSEGGDDDW